MASLLARFIPGSTRQVIHPDAASDRSSASASSVLKPTKRHTTHVRARKSISSLLGFAIRGPHLEEESDTPTSEIAACQEARHYPVYDPTNAEHGPQGLPLENAEEPANCRQQSSRTSQRPGQAKKSPSPKKQSSSAKHKSRLQGLADTLRARATLFYEGRELSSAEEELIQQDGHSMPPTPSSAKSTSSRKSVRFRSEHSSIDQIASHGSPITIPTHSPPSLSLVEIPRLLLFEIFSEEEKNLGQTGRPPQTMPSHILSGSSPLQHHGPAPPRDEQDASGNVQSLSTPMPGTNLSLEDPFDDDAAGAARLRSAQPASNTPLDSVVSDQGYGSDEESNAETCGSKHIDSSVISNDPGELVSGSHSPAQRKVRRAKPLTSNFHVPSDTGRNPSETQYDANVERSDVGDAQKAKVGGAVATTDDAGEDRTKVSDEAGQFRAEIVSCDDNTSTEPTPWRDDITYVSSPKPLTEGLPSNQSAGDYSVEVGGCQGCTESFKEPTKQDTRDGPTEANDQQSQICSTSSTSSASALHRAATTSSTSPPPTASCKRMCPGTNEGNGFQSVGNDSALGIEIPEEPTPHHTPNQGQISSLYTMSRWKIASSVNLKPKKFFLDSWTDRHCRGPVAMTDRQLLDAYNEPMSPPSPQSQVRVQVISQDGFDRPGSVERQYLEDSPSCGSSVGKPVVLVDPQQSSDHSKIIDEYQDIRPLQSPFDPLAPPRAESATANTEMDSTHGEPHPAKSSRLRVRLADVRFLRQSDHGDAAIITQPAHMEHTREYRPEEYQTSNGSISLEHMAGASADDGVAADVVIGAMA